jgi:hypothetical protein
MRHEHDEDCNIRRMSDGSVDVEYYVRVAEAWRRESLRQAFAAQGQAFEALLGPIGRLLCRFVRILGATAFGTVRRLLDFCRSSPLNFYGSD